MKQRTALLMCGTAALLAVNSVHAAPVLEIAAATVPPAQSYADLLTPIPNPVVMLRADEAARAQRPQALLQLAQYHHHHHHHHHHHGHFPFRFFFGDGFGPPAYVAPQDCYWTWGRPYWNGWRWVHPRVRVCD